MFHMGIDAAMAVRITDGTKSFQNGHLDTSIIVIRTSGLSSTLKSKFRPLLLKQEVLS
jgi:hypothetical protein